MYRFSLIALLASLIVPSSVNAQQYNQPWSFGQQNRAQLAVVMRQMEDGGTSSSTGGTSSGATAGTTIVCGGGSATATSNNTCIILNNSTGEVLTDQDSNGDQNASNSTETTTANGTDADEVLSALTGNQ